MNKLIYAPLFCLAMVIPSLKQSGLYVEGDTQVFSIVTSDNTRTNYRLSKNNPEGVVIIKPKNDEEDDISKKDDNQINIYATNNTDKFNEMIDPPIVNEKSLDDSRLVGLNDISLLAVMKVLSKRPEYTKLANPFRSDSNVEDLSQILAFVNTANQIREGMIDVEDDEAGRIDNLINSNRFKSEHKTSMKELKINGCILTSQKKRDKANNLFRVEPLPKSPRFMSRN